MTSEKVSVGGVAVDLRLISVDAHVVVIVVHERDDLRLERGAKLVVAVVVDECQHRREISGRVIVVRPDRRSRIRRAVVRIALGADHLPRELDQLVRVSGIACHLIGEGQRQGCVIPALALVAVIDRAIRCVVARGEFVRIDRVGGKRIGARLERLP